MDKNPDLNISLEQEELQMLSQRRPQTGLSILLESGAISYERMPVLEVVLDRLMRLLSTSLRALTNDVVDATLVRTSSVRFGKFIEGISQPALISIFSAVPWGKIGLINVHSDLAYNLIELLLGGRRSAGAHASKPRPYTAIEQNIVEKLVEILLSDFARAFTPVAAVDFLLDRTEVNPKFASVLMANDACLINRIKIEIGDQEGALDLLIPLATLEPVRDVLLKNFMGEKFGQDAVWESHLAQEVMQVHLRPQAILDQVTLPLSQVLAWQVGTHLPLEADEDSCILLQSGAHTIIKGRLGNIKGRVAVQVETNLLLEDPS